MAAAYTKIPAAEAPSTSYYQALTDSSGEPFRFGEWEVGLFSCCTHCVPNCCMAWCCPWFSAAKIASRLDVMSYKLTLLIYLVAVVLLNVSASMISIKHNDANNRIDGVNNGDSFYYADGVQVDPEYPVFQVLVVMAEVAIFVLVWQLRAKTRERFEIPGNCLCDCFVTLCCSCCSLAQMATHIKSYTPGNCDFGPPDTLPAYPQREATPDRV